MAAVVHGVTHNVTNNLTAYTSGAFTPAANDLLVAFVRTGETAVAGTFTTSSGITFTKIDQADFDTDDRVDLYVADSLATAVSMTATFACAGDAANGVVIFVSRVSGMTLTGASAVRQYKMAENQASATPAITFDAVCLTTNPTLGCIGDLSNPATLTPPTSWTERADSGYGTPTSGAEYVSRDSGFTGSTITWGNSTGSNWGGFIVELDSSSGGSIITAGPLAVSATGTIAVDDSLRIAIAGPLSVSGAGTISVANSLRVAVVGPLTMVATGAISVDDALRIAVVGPLAVSGASNITINASHRILVAGPLAVSGSGLVTIAGSDVIPAGDIIVAGPLSVSASGTIAVDDSLRILFAGPLGISGAGLITITGSEVIPDAGTIIVAGPLSLEGHARIEIRTKPRLTEIPFVDPTFLRRFR